MNHTPGPWKWVEDTHDIMAINDSLPKRWIAEVLESTLTTAEKPVFVREDKEWQANARLIAAAPDLLEALRAIGSALLPGEKGALRLDGKDAQGMIKIARAAILKATRKETP